MKSWFINSSLSALHLSVEIDKQIDNNKPSKVASGYVAVMQEPKNARSQTWRCYLFSKAPAEPKSKRKLCFFFLKKKGGRGKEKIPVVLENVF